MPSRAANTEMNMFDIKVKKLCKHWRQYNIKYNINEKFVVYCIRTGGSENDKIK